MRPSLGVRGRGERSSLFMSSYHDYRTLVGRCAGWNVTDLADLLRELERDVDLDEGERSELKIDVYRLIWDRSRPEAEDPSSDDPDLTT